VDCSELRIRAGVFITSEVDASMNTSNNIESAYREIVAQTYNRHHMLIFGSSQAINRVGRRYGGRDFMS
jgi:hypothetical protein